MDGMKTTGIKIANQTIKETGIFDQDIKSIFQALVIFVGDEGKVCGHEQILPANLDFGVRFVEKRPFVIVLAPALYALCYIHAITNKRCF